MDNYVINEKVTDEFGRVSGIFAVDKKVGEFSHDKVYEYRRKLGTKKVGHAGTLDPFASGLLIILVGKATKLSDQFLNLDKEYVAEIAFGVKTDTLDPEGKIVDRKEVPEGFVSKERIENVLENFMQKYLQYVPVFSSVKVEGKKLRELARNSENFEYVHEDGVLFVDFFQKNGDKKRVEIPRKEVKIYSFEILDVSTKEVKDLTYTKFSQELSSEGIERLVVAKVKVKCSKGTYIRKLAEDIGEDLSLPAMLVELRRTSVGEISL